MRVLTLNIWGLGLGLAPDRAFRVLELGKTFSAVDADVIALQEVWTTLDREHLIKAGDAAGLHYAHYFESGRSGSGLLTLSRYPIIDLGFYPFRSKGYPDKWEGDFYAGKGVGVVRLDTPNGIVDVYNAHTQAQYIHDDTLDPYVATRTAALYEISRVMMRYSGDTPLIAMGDFNNKPNQLGYKLFVAMTGVTDVYPALHADAGYTYAPENPYIADDADYERLDYIFTRGFEPVAAEVTLETIPSVPYMAYSDHYGVLAELDWGGQHRPNMADAIPYLHQFLDAMRSAHARNNTRILNHQLQAAAAALVGIVAVGSNAPRLLRIVVALLAFPAMIARFLTAFVVTPTENRIFNAMTAEVRILLENMIESSETMIQE